MGAFTLVIEDWRKWNLPMSRHFGPAFSGASTTGQRLATSPPHVTLRGGVFLTMTGLLLLLGATSAASLGYIFLRDEALKVLRDRQSRIERSYDHHLGLLRRELEKVNSERGVELAAFHARVRDLTERQAQLETRTLTLSALAAGAGIVDPATATAIARANPKTQAPGTTTQVSVHSKAPAQPPGGALSYAPPVDPSSSQALDALRRIVPWSAGSRTANTPAAPDRKEPPPLRGANLPRKPDGASAPKGEPEASAADSIPFSGMAHEARKLGSIVAGIERLDAMQIGLAAGVGRHARTEAGRLEALVHGLGLGPERLLKGIPAQEATGGPFIDLKLDPHRSTFDREILRHRSDLERVERLRRALARAPLGRPVSADAEQTSGFGSRIDPFLGRPAYHTGIDFREATGGPVFATAPGKVTAAGPNGGYGLMIELDHGNGITTRYAHLSALLVAEDQPVAANQLIGRVGSTGRSTGPHLHYEVRINDDPVDPARFVRAGEKLSSREAWRH